MNAYCLKETSALSNSMFRLLILLLLVAGYLSCENDLAEVRKVLGEDDVHVESARNVELLYSDSAVVRVQVNAPLLQRHLDKSAPFEEFPEGVEVQFLDANKQKQGSLTANYAIRYEDKRQIVVRDSVIWNSLRDECLETEELVWDERKQMVFSKKFVKITKPDEVVYGYGFEANQDFTKWKIEAVEGRIKVKSLSDDAPAPPGSLQ